MGLSYQWPSTASSRTSLYRYGRSNPISYPFECTEPSIPSSMSMSSRCTLHDNYNFCYAPHCCTHTPGLPPLHRHLLDLAHPRRLIRLLCQRAGAHMQQHENMGHEPTPRIHSMAHMMHRTDLHFPLLFLRVLNLNLTPRPSACTCHLVTSRSRISRVQTPSPTIFGTISRQYTFHYYFQHMFHGPRITTACVQQGVLIGRLQPKYNMS